MRILFANEKLGWFGGVEQNIADTAAGLRERGHECFLAWGERTTRGPEAYEALFDAAAPSRELGAEQGESLGALARRFGADRLYLHKIRRLPDRDGGPPRVRFVHDHDLCCPRRHKYFIHNARICHHPAGWRCWMDLAWLDRGGGRGPRLRPLGPHFAEMRRNHALDLLLVGSRFMREELRMNGFPEERLRILAPVVRREPAPPETLSGEPRILFVGQLIRGKGVDLLLDALARLDAPFEAEIVGDGNAREALEAKARSLGLGGAARFLGWVPNHELGAHYARARVLAVPARWPEPFGMIGLEAMHAARPVVAFATGGIPDWLEDGATGFAVPEQDTVAFAEALARLLADRDLAERLGRAGWERAQSEFSFERYLDNLALYLEEAAA